MADEEQKEFEVAVKPVPLGGWNKRDNPEVMDETMAISFENVISTYGHVKARNGYTTFYDTEWGQPINTLWTYDYHGSLFLFAATKDTIGYVRFIGINALGEGKILETPFLINDDHFQVVQFRGRNFLSSMKGSDPALMFDGEFVNMCQFVSWQQDVLQLSPNSIHNFTVYKQRLFFIERDTMRVWFTRELGAIAGECAWFDVEMFTERGGKLVSLCTWSKSGADTSETLLCCITSEGEVLLYSGTDPQADDWKQVSKTQMPEIVGIRNTTSFKDDVAIMTKGGLFALSSIAGSTMVDKNTALSDNIVGAIKTLTESFYLDNWQVIYSDALHWIIINIPQTSGAYTQYVLNMENNTWSQFTGIPSCCYVGFRYQMHFGGSNGKIYTYNKGGSDDGYPIRTYIQCAYSLFGTPQEKNLKEIVLYMFSAYRKKLYVNTIIDYVQQDTSELELPGAYGDKQIAVWGKSRWDTDFWGRNGSVDTMEITKVRTPVMSASGRRISIGLQYDVNDTAQSDVVWAATDVRYEISEH